MPKRTNPFGDCAPLQWKTRVTQRRMNEGAMSRRRMQAVCEHTMSLLYAGAQSARAAGTLTSPGVAEPPRHNGHCLLPDEHRGDASSTTVTTPPEEPSTTRGQMYLDSRGQLLHKPPIDVQKTSAHLVCATCTRSDGVHARCSRCERRTCRSCTQLCASCASTFCTVCSAVDFNSHYDAVFCFDCRQ